MVDAALDSLFSALDTKGGKVLDPEMMRFLGKAVLGTMPSAEAAKKEFSKAAGANAKTCTRDQFLAYAKAGFAKCKGQAQSPIELFQFRIASPLTPAVTPMYQPTKLTVTNTGNYLRVVPREGSVLYHGDKTFDLKYISLHTPGEHAVGGEDFPLEVQFVHREADTGDIAVLAVLYKQGVSSDFLDAIIDVAPKSVGGQAGTPDDLDLQAAIPKDITQYAQGSRVGFPHYTYEGSLTTPPCTEKVQWFVCSKPGFATKAQIDQLTKLFPVGSARPAQKANERAVEFKTLF